MAWGDPLPPKPVPRHYGGNNIPERYLDEFNRRVEERLYGVRVKHDPELPSAIAAFVEGI